MQYCSFQHQTLLPSPVTSTTECCFSFGSIPSFFLELFLHSSPIAYWALTWGVHPSVSYLFAFSYCSWGSQGKNTEVEKTTLSNSKLEVSISVLLCLVAQSRLILCNPMDCSLPGSSVHGDSPGQNTGVGCHVLSSRRSCQPRD